MGTSLIFGSSLVLLILPRLAEVGVRGDDAIICEVEFELEVGGEVIGGLSEVGVMGREMEGRTKVGVAIEPESEPSVLIILTACEKLLICMPRVVEPDLIILLLFDVL